MKDAQTIAVYEAQAAEYLEMVEEYTDPKLMAFIQCLPKEALVLDLGCGPALASVVMQEHGLRVDPVDASAAMVKLANERFSIAARQASFSDIQGQDVYHGVWANFSLLHASKEEFTSTLTALARALKPNGVLHIAMKLGSGCKRDNLGRFYSYYSKSELLQLLNAAGFHAEHFATGEEKGLAGDVEAWISIRSSLIK